MSEIQPAALHVELGSIPVPTAGRFIDESSVQITYSVADFARNTKRATSRTIPLDRPRKAAPAHDISDVRLNAASPSGELEAVLRETADSKRVVEVWRAGQLAVSHDVTDVHDAFYNDAQYGTLQFSPSETALVYVAEAKAPTKTEPAYSKFEYAPPLGEKYAGRTRPTLFVLRWAAPHASTAAHWEKPTLASVDASQSPHDAPRHLGQALFSPRDADERALLATGYDLAPDGRLLGLVYCTNRPSGIWRLTLPPLAEPQADGHAASLPITAAARLTPAHLACRSPRLDPASRTLYYIACAAGGPHASTTSVWRVPVPAPAAAEPPTPERVLDVVRDPYAASAPDGLDAPFPGFYADAALPRAPFVTAGGARHLVAASAWRSRNTLLLIAADGGAVRDLCPGDAAASWVALGTDGARRILAVRGALSVPYELAVGTLDEDGRVAWDVVERPLLKPQVAQILGRISTSVLRVPGHKTLEGLVHTSSANGTAGAPAPTILEPHGGPHGTSIPWFSPRTAVLVAAGYTVLQPNYTGSLGFGDAAARALIGRCGTLDVEDSLATLRELIRQGRAPGDPRRLFCMGGSHGGFIGGHIVGQHPDLFAACILRNPVISAGELATTDMPDWFFAEFGIEYPVVGSSAPPLMTPAHYARLHAASPIAHVARVRTPVLLSVGAADRRVAPTQGAGFFHALRARGYRADGPAHAAKGSRVQMLVFPGLDHALEGLEESRAELLAHLEWLARWGGE